jgi:hypothetical protein
LIFGSWSLVDAVLEQLALVLLDWGCTRERPDLARLLDLHAVLAALVIMFGLSDDVTVRNHLLGYFDSIVPFIVGTAAGGAVGSAVAFRRGFAEGKAS